jgi:hypothetical protein
MATFNRELRTILIQLRGSPWATVPGVAEVISEYEAFKGTAKTKHRERRVSLQIFFASRAIDTLLAVIVNHEKARLGVPVGHSEIGPSIRFIQHRTVQGHSFNTPTQTALDQLRRDRNTYLHAAALFPTDPDLATFLTTTVRAISEATTFPV